ncbi:very short patch repair endonuclease [Stenotrophomonas maltophilia]|uniref:Very short patch repair endonuclease n=1 Tax=Stenotrophomonas maltophilia TaxID=40324 RepID=A0A4S2D2Y4_STEMA|nr:DNA mismatch endonuclease Vsr [Stenotrophomonas maltophilia]TGY35759.1 DNA mismatch endonuclease Vsr [Stenotrophomonas maltophilia]
MADIVNSAKRSKMMSGIRRENTGPEWQVRRYLHAQGFRYSLHRRDLPGRPDITLSGYRSVVFVHGCFWHAHRACKYAKLPGTRADFWREKLEGNRARDERHVQQLLEGGWRVAVVWECALKGAAASTLAELSGFLRSGHVYAEFAMNHLPKIE